MVKGVYRVKGEEEHPTCAYRRGQWLRWVNE